MTKQRTEDLIEIFVDTYTTEEILEQIGITFDEVLFILVNDGYVELPPWLELYLEEDEED